MDTDAFFVRDGEVFVATEMVRGPWDDRFAHGGPPSALIARAAELEGAERGTPHVARLTVDLLRPVPIAPLHVRSSVVRAGRTALVLSLSLGTGEQELARASALCLRTAPIDVVPNASARPIPTADSAPPFELPFFRPHPGYHRAMDLRIAEGTFGEGPTVGWLRMRIPLVRGEAPSGLVRVLVAADSSNGISPVLDWRTHTFVNPDLSVMLHRAPEGEWIAMDASTTVEANGLGQAHSRLYDARGPIGHAVQSLILAAR
jgi:hypothetical protein